MYLAWRCCHRLSLPRGPLRRCQQEATLSYVDLIQYTISGLEKGRLISGKPILTRSHDPALLKEEYCKFIMKDKMVCGWTDSHLGGAHRWGQNGPGTKWCTSQGTSGHWVRWSVSRWSVLWFQGTYIGLSGCHRIIMHKQREKERHLTPYVQSHLI